jgi:hypothetical protein
VLAVRHENALMLFGATNGAAEMARYKRSEPQDNRGVFEKEPGTNIWWIRYTDGAGKHKREKVGRRGDAVTLYQSERPMHASPSHHL